MKVEPKQAIRLGLGLVALAVVAWFLVRYLGHHWPAVSAHPWRFDPTRLALSVLVVTISLLMVADGWRRILATLGGHVPPLEAWRVWAMGQTSKYVPGMVWPMVAKVAFTRRHGIHAGAVALSGLLEIALTVGCALLVGALSLPFQPGEWDVLHQPLLGPLPVWSLGPALCGLALLTLHPRLFAPLSGVLLKVARVETRPPDFTPSRAARLVGWFALTWAIHALGMALFVSAAAPEIALADLPALGGAYVIAFISGFLVFFLPMGLGVQEAAFAALAAPMLPDPAVAVVLCLATRLVLGGGELLALALAVVGLRVRGGQRPASLRSDSTDP